MRNIDLKKRTLFLLVWVSSAFYCRGEEPFTEKGEKAGSGIGVITTNIPSIEQDLLVTNPPPISSPISTNKEVEAKQIAETNLAQTNLSHSVWSPVSPGANDAGIAKIVSLILEQAHFLRQPFDDEVSRRFLERYLDSLDYQHSLFLKSDIDEFTKLQFVLDDLTMRGDTRPGYLVFNRFMERFRERNAFLAELLDEETFEFITDETYNPDRHEQSYPKNLEEAQKIWRDRLRFEFLQEKLTGQKAADIPNILRRRYARQLKALEEFDADIVLQNYLNALTRVYDPHSDYMGRSELENFSIGMKLSLYGIGAQLRSEDGYCIVQELIVGGPAYKAKEIKPNDKIIAVAQGDSEPVDVVDMNLNKVVELIRGDKGTEVRLTIIPSDAPDPTARKVVKLIRDEIKLEEKEAKAKIIEFPIENAKSLRLGLIDLPSFYADMGITGGAPGPNHKSTTADVAKLLTKLIQEGIDGVILDLRLNGGGSLEEAINLTGLFIDRGPVVQVRDIRGNVAVQEDKNSGVLYNGPLVLLTSRFSASASEIFAGALQDYGRAVVVGDASTHGKGTVQSLVQLAPYFKQIGLNPTNNPGALKITVQKFYRASGASTQLRGVVPDIILPSPNVIQKTGEAALENPLPWDEIKTAKYTSVNMVNSLVSELQKLSTDRIAKDQDFKYVTEDIEEIKRMLENKSVSMNEKQRLEEKKAVQEKINQRNREILARKEPAYRVYELKLKDVTESGLPPAVVISNGPVVVAHSITNSQSTAEDDDLSSEDSSEKSAPQAPPVDYFLKEAKHVLVDLIRLSKEKALAGK